MCARVSAHARRERVQGKVRRDRGRGLVPSVPPRDATGAGYGPRASGSDASPSRSPPPRPHVSPPAAPSKASAPRMDYQLSPLLPSPVASSSSTDTTAAVFHPPPSPRRQPRPRPPTATDAPARGRFSRARTPAARRVRARRPCARRGPLPRPSRRRRPRKRRPVVTRARSRDGEPAGRRGPSKESRDGKAPGGGRCGVRRRDWRRACAQGTACAKEVEDINLRNTATPPPTGGSPVRPSPVPVTEAATQATGNESQSDPATGEDVFRTRRKVHRPGAQAGGAGKHQGFGGGTDSRERGSDEGKRNEKRVEKTMTGST